MELPPIDGSSGDGKGRLRAVPKLMTIRRCKESTTETIHKKESRHERGLGVVEIALQIDPTQREMQSSSYTNRIFERNGKVASRALLS